MTATVDIEEATLLELVEALNGSGSVIVTSGPDKKPVARVEAIPEPPKNPKRLGFLKHLNLPPIPDSAFFDPLPEEELGLWEGEDS